MSASEQKLEVFGYGFRRNLLEGALPRRLVWTKAKQLSSMTEAIAGNVVVADLDNDFRFERLPFAGALSAPAARPARGLAGEAWRSDECLECLGQGRALRVG